MAQAYLKNKKTACAYLQSALDDYQTDHDKKTFMPALKDVEKEQGKIKNLSSETYLNREHLYRVLSG